MFEQLTFYRRQWIAGKGLLQATKKYGPYELSVIKESHKQYYEIAILDTKGLFVRLPGIHKDYFDDDAHEDVVISGLNKRDISVIMKKLELIVLKEGTRV